LLLCAIGKNAWKKLRRKAGEGGGGLSWEILLKESQQISMIFHGETTSTTATTTTSSFYRIPLILEGIIKMLMLLQKFHLRIYFKPSIVNITN